MASHRESHQASIVNSASAVHGDLRTRIAEAQSVFAIAERKATVSAGALEAQKQAAQASEARLLEATKRKEALRTENKKLLEGQRDWKQKVSDTPAEWYCETVVGSRVLVRCPPLKQKWKR